VTNDRTLHDVLQSLKVEQAAFRYRMNSIDLEQQASILSIGDKRKTNALMNILQGIVNPKLTSYLRTAANDLPTQDDEEDVMTEELPTTPPSPGWQSPSPPMTPPCGTESSSPLRTNNESEPTGTKPEKKMHSLGDRRNAILATSVEDMERQNAQRMTDVTDDPLADQDMQDTGEEDPEDAFHWRIV
jgi:hypothetical protein